MTASIYTYLEIVIMLLDRGADVNSQTYEGWTPLMFASENGYFEIVIVLLDRGADVNLRGKEWSALTLSSQRCHYKIIKELLNRGADTDFQSEGRSFLNFLVGKYKKDIEDHMVKIARIKPAKR